MPQFNLITHAPEHIREQSRALDRFYYHIDTASTEEVKSWVDFNPFIVTHALLGDEHFGYFNLMPLKPKAAALFAHQEISEEDITEQHIVPPDLMMHATHFYLPAITVKDFTHYKSRCCVAALLAGLATHMLRLYDIGAIEMIYANPTTFQGNHFAHKLGLAPVKSYKKPLSVSDVYALQVTPDIRQRLEATIDRYSRFINTNVWTDPAIDWSEKLKNFSASA